ncbi:unnamed protein product [Prorocentrum cordatum]|nr:unnamed protein product [Polarella glacialis]
MRKVRNESTCTDTATLAPFPPLGASWGALVATAGFDSKLWPERTTGWVWGAAVSVSVSIGCPKDGGAGKPGRILSVAKARRRKTSFTYIFGALRGFLGSALDPPREASGAAPVAVHAPVVAIQEIRAERWKSMLMPCFFPLKTTVTVHWQATGVVESHYRCGTGAAVFGNDRGDLCLAKGFEGPSRSKIMAAFKGFTSSARNSQTTFADREQTVIILDWDDTLFPSTFVRSDMRMTLGLPLRHQKLSEPVKRQVARSLAECAAKADKLLRLCASYGNLVIVTLARANWVTDCCGCFYPGIGELLRQLNVKIVYAQEGVTIDQKKVQAMNVQQCEMFWGAIKGRAISDEIKSFYSQYEGQSWKNIISIGDSNFEKIGTMTAAADYMRENGIEVPADLAHVDAAGSSVVAFQASTAATVVVKGHTFHVRTKVAKMLDEPTVDELQVGLELMRQWLPMMVRHDGGFSLNLAGLGTGEDAQEIERQLREGQRCVARPLGPPCLLGASPGPARFAAKAAR